MLCIIIIINTTSAGVNSISLAPTDNGSSVQANSFTSPMRQAQIGMIMLQLSYVLCLAGLVNE